MVMTAYFSDDIAAQTRGKRGFFWPRPLFDLDELRRDMACAIAQQYVKKEVFDEHTKQYGSVAEGHWG